MSKTLCYYCHTDYPPEFCLVHKDCLDHLREDNDILKMRLTDCSRIMDSLRAKRDELQAKLLAEGVN